MKLALSEAGLAAKVVYSGGADVDILAVGAGKGRALEFVVQQLRKKARIPEDGPVMVSVGAHTYWHGLYTNASYNLVSVLGVSLIRPLRMTFAASWFWKISYL